MKLAEHVGGTEQRQVGPRAAESSGRPSGRSGTIVRWSRASSGATRRQRSPLTAAPWANTTGGPLPRSRYSSVPAGTSTVLRSPRASLIAMRAPILPRDTARGVSARHGIFVAPFDELSEPGGRGRPGRARREPRLGRPLRLGPRAVPGPGARRGRPVDHAGGGGGGHRAADDRAARDAARTAAAAQARPRDRDARPPQRRPARARGRPRRRPQRRVRRRALRRGGGPARAGRAARRRARAPAALLGRRVRAAPGTAAADPGLGGRPLAEPAPAGASGALGRPVPDRPARPRGAGRGGRGDRVAARRRRSPATSTSW